MQRMVRLLYRVQTITGSLKCQWGVRGPWGCSFPTMT